jgi:hypothetical protein
MKRFREKILEISCDDSLDRDILVEVINLILMNTKIHLEK